MDNFYADVISQDPQFDSVKRVNDPDLDKRRQVTPRQRANRSSDRAAGSDGLVNFAPPCRCKLHGLLCSLLFTSNNLEASNHGSISS